MANNQDILAPPPVPTGQMPGQPDRTSMQQDQMASIQGRADEARAMEAGMGQAQERPGSGIDATEPAPGEQEQYNQVMYGFSKLVYGDGKDAVIKKMNNPDKAVHENVAQAQYTIMREIIKMADESSREPMSPDVIFHTAPEQISVLMDVGDMAGIWPFEVETEEYNKAMEMAFIESQKLFGDELIASPDSAMHSEDAGNYATEHVARDKDAGNLNPYYQEGIAAMEQNPNYNTDGPPGQPMAKMNPLAAGVKQGMKQ